MPPISSHRKGYAQSEITIAGTKNELYGSLIEGILGQANRLTFSLNEGQKIIIVDAFEFFGESDSGFDVLIVFEG